MGEHGLVHSGASVRQAVLCWNEEEVGGGGGGEQMGREMDLWMQELRCENAPQSSAKWLRRQSQGMLGGSDDISIRIIRVGEAEMMQHGEKDRERYRGEEGDVERWEEGGAPEGGEGEIEGRYVVL